MITNSSFKMTKMQGTGNDFLILDLYDIESLRIFEKRVLPQNRSEWAKRVCDRHFGMGADGLMFLQSHDDYDFQWDFYNSDGSSAEMCGNAARCAALYAKDHKWSGTKMTFLSLAGPIHAEVTEDNCVHIESSLVKEDTPENFKSSEGDIQTFQRINTGVPHSVIVVEDSEPLTVDHRKSLAKQLRRDSSHGPNGSNVTFYRVIDQNQIESVSFERGVEDFTLACGTGVLAAGYHFCKSKGIAGCEVHTPGGQLLVNIEDLKKPRLTGPATYVANIFPNMELF